MSWRCVRRHLDEAENTETLNFHESSLLVEETYPCPVEAASQPIHPQESKTAEPPARPGAKLLGGGICAALLPPRCSAASTRASGAFAQGLDRGREGGRTQPMRPLGSLWQSLGMKCNYVGLTQVQYRWVVEGSGNHCPSLGTRRGGTLWS